MIERLSVSGFRNLESFDWQVPAGATLLLGGNGAGKTSVLEGVHLAATTRSFRTSQIADCLRRGGNGGDDAGDGGDDAGDGGDDASALSIGVDVAAVSASAARTSLTLSWSADDGLDRRRDDKTVPLGEYLEVLPVVSWTAREDEILAGLPERRRRMLDGGVVTAEPGRLAELSRYRRTLSQKRELLRRRQRGLAEWNALLAPAAVSVITQRARFVERLQNHLAEVQARSGLELPAVELRYEPSPAEGLEGADAVFEKMEARRDDETRLLRPLVGPHLDRLQILWRGVDVSRVASAGERKALGLLLVAAQAETLAARGRQPVVLADDLDAELDLRALGAVWGVLGSGRQVLASSNRAEVADRLEGISVVPVEAGALVPGNSP